MDAPKKTPETAAPKPALMKLAEELRSKTNNLSDDQREDAFRHGMQLIYGGNGKGVPAKASRP